MDFSIETRILGNGVPVLILKGEVDVYTTPQMKEHLSSLIQQGAKQIVVDLSNVSYFDSTALGALIGALHRLKEHEGNILIAGASARVKRVFEITGLDKVFDMYETIEQISAN